MHSDITRIPLTEKEIAFLVPMGVQFWTYYKTGETFISRRWWNNIKDTKREAIEIILNHWHKKTDA